MKFEKPSIEGLSADEIRALRADAVAKASEIDTGEDSLSDEALADLEAIAEFIAEADAAADEADKAATERAERLAAARGALAPKDEEKVEPEPVEPKDEEKVDEDEKTLVTASAAKPRKGVASRAAAKAPEPIDVEKAKGIAVITAAADVPGFATGKALSGLDEVVDAALARFQAMPQRKVGSSFNRYGVAQIQKTRTDGLSMSNPEYASLQDLIAAASKESRLSGGSLTAAGGWCAPSEVLYDLCSIESTDGLWDVPEVNAPRGGLAYTKGPSFADIYNLPWFNWSEADAENPETPDKECAVVECPDPLETRLNAIGFCIQAGLLTNAAYPELVRRYIEGTIIAQQHRVSGWLIQQALAITGAANTITNPWPNATSILTAIELVIEGERQRNRLPLAMTLEVVLPVWLKAAIRADLSQRTGVDLLNVTDAMIEGYFTNRGARVQWVYNWQDLTITTGTAPDLVQVAATDYPDTVEALVYPAGTFVKLTNDVITLDAVYDSTGLARNTYTAMFAEEGVALANMCYDARRISLPLSVSGLTSAAIQNQDWNAAPPLYEEPAA